METYLWFAKLQQNGIRCVLWQPNKQKLPRIISLSAPWQAFNEAEGISHYNGLCVLKLLSYLKTVLILLSLSRFSYCITGSLLRWIKLSKCHFSRLVHSLKIHKWTHKIYIEGLFCARLCARPRVLTKYLHFGASAVAE